jgi:hypothetical protein
MATAVASDGVDAKIWRQRVSFWSDGEITQWLSRAGQRQRARP